MYLVLSIPQCCLFCPSSHTRGYERDSMNRIDEIKFCGIMNINLSIDEYYQDRPEWCPLREIPEPRATTYPDQGKPHRNGWNDCIDELMDLLGGK